MWDGFVKRLFPLLVLAAAVIPGAEAPQAPRKIQVMIVTGQDKHPWPARRDAMPRPRPDQRESEGG